MSKQSHQFLNDAQRVAFDLEHRRKIKFNIGKYDLAVEKGRERYSHQPLAKQRAAFLKRRVLNRLPELLEELENNLVRNGAEVHWAQTDADVLKIIGEVARREQVKCVVKSKSMTTEEVELNHFFESMNVEPLETDLGEFIVQVAGEKPYHIVTPAMHKSKEDIDALFHQKFKTPSGSTPQELTAWVRNFLRQKFVTSEMGVTGANFLVADTGSVCLTENEGNALLTASLPRIHVVIAAIEKVIPSAKYLGLMWPLLSALGTGQQMTVYNSIFSSPRKPCESDGPEKMIVILMDNGRTNLYADHHLYEALSCIRCGACLNACPVYKNVGGYTYGATYSGPIGSLITPHFKGMQAFKHLSFASSLCGKCAEVCPVQIPIPDLLLENRRKSVESGCAPVGETIMFNMATLVMKRRALFNMNGNLKTMVSGLTMSKMLGNQKKFPKFAAKSFSVQWNNKR
ncbi:L-lactate dehydrogenase complex protein LldF [Breznakibacter xylanolyticus]|uniref:L-lactate dehydrogenase complex protein LldF n=1 Tax=Breznakibacter xylanolyticus TaxID=990 RepID=A0A2W7NG82_9BACT|nr:lactate utilization protein B [Breznakibacter xylanolyticus]PZX19405.1 L-lactate dehydrogenase complex protein LldF [Breznakibacter xylanolyticus]